MTDSNGPAASESRSTLRATFTDWEQVRAQAQGSGLDAKSPASKVEGFLNRAYDNGLTSGSGVDESTRAMAEKFGFSALDTKWEVLGQSRQGQVDVMRLHVAHAAQRRPARDQRTLGTRRRLSLPGRAPLARRLRAAAEQDHHPAEAEAGHLGQPLMEDVPRGEPEP